MTRADLSLPGRELPDVRDAYLRYKLGASEKQLKHMIFLIGFFNLFLLVPDYAIMRDTGKFGVILLARGVFSLVLFLTLCSIGRLKTFRSLAVAVSACELLSLVVFIFIFILYETPDLLIQTMGLLVIIIAVFVVPNQWSHMLAVSVIGAAAFLACAWFFIDGLEMVLFWVAAVYAAVTILLCALSAYLTDTYQFREFIAKRELERLSSTDYLTQTANRYKMDEEANRWIGFCRRNGLPLSLVFLDIDNFKAINDRYGHLAGDGVLTELTELIRGQLRNTDILSRWGGDEFVLLLPNTALHDAVAITRRIRTQACETVFPGDIRLTCCFGVAEMREDSDFERLLKEADRRMYAGKTQKDTLRFED